MGWGGACVNVHVNLQGQWTRLCMFRYVHVDMAFNDAPVSKAICVHVVLALHPGQSRSTNVPRRTRTVAVRKKTIKEYPLEVSTKLTCMKACLWPVALHN